MTEEAVKELCGGSAENGELCALPKGRTNTARSSKDRPCIDCLTEALNRHEQALAGISEPRVNTKDAAQGGGAMKTEPQDEKESPEAPDENAPGDAPGELCGKTTPFPNHPPCFLAKNHEGFCQAEAYWCLEHSAPRIGGICVVCGFEQHYTLENRVLSAEVLLDRFGKRLDEIQEQLADHFGDGSQQHVRADSARDRAQDLEDEVAARRRMDGWAPVKLLFSREMYLAVLRGLLPGMSVEDSVLNRLDEVERERQADLRVEHKNAKSLVNSVSVLWRLYFPKGGSNGDES